LISSSPVLKTFNDEPAGDRVFKTFNDEPAGDRVSKTFNDEPAGDWVFRRLTSRLSVILAIAKTLPENPLGLERTICLVSLNRLIRYRFQIFGCLIENTHQSCFCRSPFRRGCMQRTNRGGWILRGCFAYPIKPLFNWLTANYSPVRSLSLSLPLLRGDVWSRWLTLAFSLFGAYSSFNLFLYIRSKSALIDSKEVAGEAFVLPGTLFSICAVLLIASYLAGHLRRKESPE
jgi:hypothetical protein